MSRANDLRTLGLDPNARPDDRAVKKAYHKLALQRHPDKPGGSK